MKAFVATIAMAAAATAAPEANHHHLLAQQQPLVYGLHSNGMVHHSNGAVVPDDTYAVKAAKVDHLTAKAQAYLNKPVVPLVQTVAAQPVIQTVASPVYSAFSGLNTLGYPYAHLIKREADAEADPQLMLNTPYAAYTSGVHNMAYNGVYNYIPAAAKTVVPTVAQTMVQTPVVTKSVISPVYSNMYNYRVYGGAHMIAKRDAEPQLMLQAPYTTHPINYQQPIYGYNMPSVMTPFMYNTHLIHKREADTDPAVFYNYGMPAYTAATGLYNQMHPITTVAQSQVIPSVASYNIPYTWY